jgi:hypothetical protein
VCIDVCTEVPLCLDVMCSLNSTKMIKTEKQSTKNNNSCFDQTRMNTKNETGELQVLLQVLVVGCVSKRSKSSLIFCDYYLVRAVFVVAVDEEEDELDDSICRKFFNTKSIV